MITIGRITPTLSIAFVAMRCIGQIPVATLGYGVYPQYVSALFADTLEPYLYVTGGFHHADSLLTSPAVTRWDGTQFSPVGCGFNYDCISPIGSGGVANPPYVMSRWNGDLYAGGAFQLADGDSISRIARWDGAAWNGLAGGVNGPVRGLKAYADGLYVAGWYHYADTLHTNGLARWDGTQWHEVHPLPEFETSGVNRINDVAYYNGELYIGGNFGAGLNDFAKWDGSAWVPIGGGFLGTFCTVNKLAVHNGLLYVAGSFADYPPNGSPSNPGSGILAFDGTNWIDLAGGTEGSGNPTILDLVWHGDTLFVCGVFDRIGGMPTAGLAKWNGSKWCSLIAEGENIANITSVAFFRDTLHIGGSFTQLYGDTVTRIAMWIGGAYVDSCGFGVGINESPTFDHAFAIRPNPALDFISISAPLMSLVSAEATVYDAVGKEVGRTALTPDHRVDVAHLSAGLYTLRLCDARGAPLGSARFVKQ